jgi:hypothetical protein
MKISGAALEALSKQSRISAATTAVEKERFLCLPFSRVWLVLFCTDRRSSDRVDWGVRSQQRVGVGAAAAAKATPRVLSGATDGAPQLSASSSILTVTEASLILSRVSHCRFRWL